VVGRFLSVDPLAVDFAAWSPYNYVLNNPVLLLDPTGRAAEEDEDDDEVDGRSGISIRASLGLAGVLIAFPEPTSSAGGIILLLGTGIVTGVAVGDLLTHVMSEDNVEETTRNPAQDKKLTKGEIKKLKDGEVDPEKLKIEITGSNKTGQFDLFKDKGGNIFVKPKGGRGPGEPTGININNL